ncbi:MAG: formimidoylglutamate deiminase, partial [Pseudomonadota bacterium]|nr:formimidoylglutamate deiminase [Pseudomonadota bacterium]
MQKFFAKAAFLPDGWADDVVISVDDHGFISAVEKNAKANDAQLLDGAVIPAMPNLHSHAFQRAFAGRSEFATATQDSFWTWRKLMYKFLTDLDADKLESIATELYTEMRQAGFSQVGEFHYIHHCPDGTPYEEPAELSHAMIRAAKTAGIGITLLPVLYAYSGFGAQPPEDGQKRFLHDAQSYLALIRQLHGQYKDTPMVKIGAAFHSLRAVSPEIMRDTLTGLNDIDPAMPIHIHIAEQVKEVEDCINWCGKRPVAWLLENAPVNQNWCLVHATHMDADETKALAQSGAVAGLCPITEATLGDGLFN